MKAIRTHSRQRVLPLFEWMNFNEFLLAPQRKENQRTFVRRPASHFCRFPSDDVHCELFPHLEHCHLVGTERLMNYILYFVVLCVGKMSLHEAYPRMSSHWQKEANWVNILHTCKQSSSVVVLRRLWCASFNSFPLRKVLCASL